MCACAFSRGLIVCNIEQIKTDVLSFLCQGRLPIDRSEITLELTHKYLIQPTVRHSVEIVAAKREYHPPPPPKAESVPYIYIPTTF